MKRTVFYIPGFDPRSAGFYHRLYKRQAKAQSMIDGCEYTVSAREKVGAHEVRWQVQAHSGAGSAQTTYRVLAWDDLVRVRWPQGMGALLLGWGRLFSAYLVRPLWRVACLAKGPLIAALAPQLFVAFAALLAVWIASMAYSWVNGVAPAALALSGTSLLGFGIFYGLWVVGERLKVYWLLRLYIFAERWANAGDPDLEARLRDFADTIEVSLSDAQTLGVDDVLLVAHSVGVMLVIPVVAHLEARGVDTSRLTVLTLGHCVPTISVLPRAGFYRAYQAQARRFAGAWFDVGAAMDGACFYRVNPLTDRAAPDEPVQSYTARFHTLFSAKAYRRLRRNWYAMHFQYLCATEKPGLMDYTALTAGPETVRERFARYPTNRLFKVVG